MLQKSKCSLFHNIFKYMFFKGAKRRYYGVRNKLSNPYGRNVTGHLISSQRIVFNCFYIYLDPGR